MTENVDRKDPRGRPAGCLRQSLDALDLALESQKLEAEQDDFLIDLLPLLDGVEKLCRDLDQQPPEVSAERREALALLPEIADEAARKIDLERVGRPGEAIDRRRHEVVATVSDAERPHGTVTEVIESGWSFQGRLLRLAKVVATSRLEDQDA